MDSEDKTPPTTIEDPSRLVQALNTFQTFQRQPESEYVDSSSMKRMLRQSSSIDLQNVVQLDVKNESRVLVLYTGCLFMYIKNDSCLFTYYNKYVIAVCLHF